MLELRVTLEAKRDLLSIGRYTEKQWCAKQRRSYLKAIDERFYWLAQYPEFGKNRDSIKPGYLSYQQGKHVIFYMVNGNYLDIIGVLHERMDFKQHL